MAELLPTGTVTLLLADVEGSTQLWEKQQEVMTAAIALLNRTVDQLVAEHGGVRPVEQGEGDSFVAAFARAGDAVTCALDLQRAEMAPIKLRIGVHTGDVQLRDEANYAGTTINKTARLRDLAHGGQTVISAATEEMVEDQLPAEAWLTDLGRHGLRDLPRPVRVSQLCHPDLRNDFPPLRTANAVATHNLPAQLTSFVGRVTQITEISNSLGDDRLITLTGAGGAGKTRLAIEVAGKMGGSFPDGICYADLAPITHPDVVPLTVARALGLPDQPGRSITETLLRSIRDRRLLLVLDNCEHLLEASAELVNDVLAGCSRVTILTTSREPLMVPGEVNWQVPSLSLADEAVQLFTDRARRARPAFAVTEANSQTVTDICRRLDGMPLAIELAAARVRALSLDEIVGSLHDRFRLLTGGARTAVRRQQTLARVRGLVTRPAHRTRAGPLPALGRIHGRLRPRRRPSRRRDHRGGALPGPRPTQPAGRQVTRRRREHLWPNALPAAGNRPSVCAGEAWRVGRGRRGARTAPRSFLVDGGAARRSGNQRPSTAHFAGVATRSTTYGPRSLEHRERRDLEGVGARHVPAIGVARAGRIREGLAWLDTALADDAKVDLVRLRPTSERSPTRHCSTLGTAHSTPRRGESRSRLGNRPKKRRPGAADSRPGGKGLRRSLRTRRRAVFRRGGAAGARPGRLVAAEPDTRAAVVPGAVRDRRPARRSCRRTRDATSRDGSVTIDGASMRDIHRGARSRWVTSQAALAQAEASRSRPAPPTISCPK